MILEQLKIERGKSFLLCSEWFRVPTRLHTKLVLDVRFSAFGGETAIENTRGTVTHRMVLSSDEIAH